MSSSTIIENPTDPYSGTPPINQQANKAVSSFTALFIVFGILGVGATLLTTYTIYRYLTKHGLPSINVNTTGGGDAAATAEPLPDSTIRSTTIENFLNEIAREKPIRFMPQQLAGYTQHMAPGAELGSGGYGTVYKGMLPNGLDIAVKVLNEGMGSEVTEQQFMAEVGTLWRTNHANLIRLIGFCFDDGVHALVYELMARRSLDVYLFDRRHAVGAGALLAMAAGVARGLRYLHEECQKKIIHYDVKASNVLLDEFLNPKLTDFGIAQLLSRADTHASVHGLRGTNGYMAPEVIHKGMTPVTEKCDVYSFGMLLFEVVGRRKNTDNDEAREDYRWLPLLVWKRYERGRLMELVKECHSSSMAAAAAAEEERWGETVERMCKVAFLCVQERPEARPTMSMVVNMLEGNLDIPDPVFPFGWMYPGGVSSGTSTTRDEAIISIDLL